MSGASETGFEPVIGRYLRLDLLGQPQRLYVEEAGEGIPLPSRVILVAVAGTILMQGGYAIEMVSTPWGPIGLGLASYPVTLLWLLDECDEYATTDHEDHTESDNDEILVNVSHCISVLSAE